MEKQMYSYEYPRPAVATDCVIFGFDGKLLHLLLIERGLEPFLGMWALPGGFVRINETAEQCAARELEEETGLREVYMEQFKVFSDVHRHPNDRVITIAFLALVSKESYQLLAGDDATRAEWFLYNELPPLAFDHKTIIDAAKTRLVELVKLKPIAFKLLGKEFKMSELQRLYEIINQTQYDRRNFSRKIRSSGFVIDKEINNTIMQKEEKLPMAKTKKPIKQSEKPGRQGIQHFSFDEKKYEEEQARSRKNPLDI